ncbi:transcription factor bHLH25-like isoform X1 [Arachis stenosperma]|uniref:transcription factor bHLH25-like isoform X1 n=2 Tax=Arachis stenosperma TaxID=217475 RepID=UPI0025AD3B26|nr:transcription factor bHLH25-like isoform X1 [Arachis stenosperma]
MKISMLVGEDQHKKSTKQQRGGGAMKVLICQHERILGRVNYLMEISSELGIMEDPNSFLWHLSSIDTCATTLTVFGDSLQKNNPLFCNSNLMNSKISMMETTTSPTTTIIERPAKQLRSNNTSNWSSHINKTPESHFVGSCSNNILSFVDNTNHHHQLGLVMKPKVEIMSSSPNNIDTQGTTLLGNNNNHHHHNHENYLFKESSCHEAKNFGQRPKLSSHQPHDHIIAERKRREKLSQRFIALSALVPGLKKMDKASVLGDAIKYLKQMQEKVSALEEEQKKKKTVESVVMVKKSQLCNDDEDSCSSETEPLPEIEARFCERNVLIRVHCEKKKGVIENTIIQIEKLHLKVINSSVLTFGNFALDITIIAQMDMEFSMTVKELVKNLRSAFSTFM